MKSVAEIAIPEHHDVTGAKLGMWLFLFTEMLLFGGMFLLYAMYRSKYAAQFHLAGTELNVVIGTINTLVLLTSSLTVAIAVEALRRKNQKLSLYMLGLTIFFALIFLVNKYFEWSTKIHHGIFPGSAELLSRPKGEILYFGLYYVMTGLHGLHVLVGMGVLSFMFYFIARNPSRKIVIPPFKLSSLRGAKVAVVQNPGKQAWEAETISDQVREVEIIIRYDNTPETMDRRNEIKLENAALYWHLVDIIWIFLFPLFYLIA